MLGALAILGVFAAVTVVRSVFDGGTPRSTAEDSAYTGAEQAVDPTLSADVSFPAFGVYLKLPSNESPTKTLVTAEQAISAAGRIGIISDQTRGVSPTATLYEYTQTFAGNPIASENDKRVVTHLAWDVAFVGSSPDLRPPAGMSETDAAAAANSYGQCETHVLVAADQGEVLQTFQACG